MCTTLASHLEPQLFRGSDAQTVAAEAAEVCQQLSGSASTACDRLVSTHLDSLKSSLLQGSDARSACGSLGYCGPPVSPARSQKLTALRASAAKLRSGVAKPVSAKQLPKDIFCDICQAFVGDLERLLNETIEIDLEGLIANLCDPLGYPLSALCAAALDSVVEDIIAYIEAGLDSLDICGSIGLCARPPAGRTARRAPQAVVCDVCQELVAHASASRDAEAAVLAIGRQLPGVYGVIARDVIAPAAASIGAGASSFSACGQLGLCDATCEARDVRPLGTARELPKGIFCDICQAFVGDLEGLLNGTIEGDIEQLIAGLCDPLGEPFSALCALALDQVVDSLIDAIVAGIDSLHICSSIGLCAVPGRAPRIAPRRARAPPQPRPCTVAQAAIQYVGELRRGGAAAPQVSARFAELCAALPAGDATICRGIDPATVVEWVDAGVSALDGARRLGLCGPGRQIAAKAVKRDVGRKIPKDILCDICRQLILDIELLLNTTIEPDLDALVAQLCDPLPPPVNVLCSSFFDDNIQIIIDFINQELDDLQICQLIGACASKGKKARRVHLLQTPRKSAESLICSVSQDYAGFVRQLVFEGKGEAEIAARVAQLTAAIPRVVGTVVGATFGGHLGEILAWVADAQGAFEIAQRLQLCRASDTRRPNALSVRRPAAKQIPKDILCDICQQFVLDLELLLNTTIEPDVEALVAQLCDPLPPPVNVLCSSFLDENLEIVINFINEELDELQICQLIGACAPSAKPPRKPRRPTALWPKRAVRAAPNDIVCDFCQDIINYIAGLVADDIIGPVLEGILDEICSVLPAPFGSLCTSFVQQNINEIVAQILAGIESLDICAGIGLCSTAAPKRPVRPPMRALKRGHALPADFFCETCQEVIEYIKQLLDEGVTLRDIEALVQQMCSALGLPGSQVCTSFIDHYFEEIVAELAQGIDPFDTCGGVGLCGASSKKRVRKVQGKPVFKKIPGDIFCDICQSVIDYIVELVLNGTVEPVIEELVAELCDTLPFPLSTLCTDFIDQYIEEIIADIEAGAEDICADIGVCASPARVVKRRASGQRRVAKRPKVHHIN